MRAVVYDAVGAPPTIRDVVAPECPSDGVLVRVHATGLCRSDWHAWRGHDPVPMPQIPGHELAGTVAAVGPAVRRFRIGDRVTVPFVCGCGQCETCLAGDQQVCPHQTQPGFTGPGSFAELVALHAADTNLVRLPDGIDFPTAALLGCRFATAYRALTVHGRVQGGWVAVHGCGGVGLSAIMVARALGAQVVAVDVAPAALSLAARMGAAATVNATMDDVVGAIHEVTSGGAAISVDAVGSEATAAASIRSLRRRGRHLQVGLLLGQEATPRLPMDRVVSQELEIYGCHGMPAREYPAMLASIEAGQIRPDLLIGRRIGLEEAPAALMAMDHLATTTGVTMIEPQRLVASG